MLEKCDPPRESKGAVSSKNSKLICLVDLIAVSFFLLINWHIFEIFLMFYTLSYTSGRNFSLDPSPKEAVQPDPTSRRMGRTIHMKKIPEPFRTIRTILHFLSESAIRGGSVQEIRRPYLPTGIRTAAVPYESTPVSLYIHAVWAKTYK